MHQQPQHLTSHDKYKYPVRVLHIYKFTEINDYLSTGLLILQCFDDIVQQQKIFQEIASVCFYKLSQH